MDISQKMQMFKKISIFISIFCLFRGILLLLNLHTNDRIMDAQILYHKMLSTFDISIFRLHYDAFYNALIIFYFISALAIIFKIKFYYYIVLVTIYLDMFTFGNYFKDFKRG